MPDLTFWLSLILGFVIGAAVLWLQMWWVERREREARRRRYLRGRARGLFRSQARRQSSPVPSPSADMGVADGE